MTKIISLLFFFFSWFNISIAEQILIQKFDVKQPIKIFADNISIYYKKGKAYLNGNVVTLQGDLEITADKVSVDFTNLPGKNWKINDITYENKVTVNSSYIMKSERAYLNIKKGELVLENNVRIMKDKNQLKGEKLIYNFVQGTVKIVGNNFDRSKVIINIK